MPLRCVWGHLLVRKFIILAALCAALQSKVRSKVEHIFYIVKRLFGYRKAVYRGLAKNTARLYMLFASANLLKRAWSERPYMRPAAV